MLYLKTNTFYETQQKIALTCKNHFYNFIWAPNTQIENMFITESALDLTIH